MSDILAPLRPLRDPYVTMPFEPEKMKDNICGTLGPMKFAVMLLSDEEAVVVIGRPDRKLTKGNLDAFWRRWGVPRGEAVGDHILVGTDQRLMTKNSAMFVVTFKNQEENEMITPMIDDRGLTAAVCTCDVCGREAHERAKFQHSRRGADDRQMDEGQVRLRLQGKGWTYVKNVLRCPSCEDARKASDKPPVSENAMTDKLKTLTVVPKAEPQIEPTREQKRQIVALLDSVYDKERECYSGKETDATVTEALGPDFRVEWVATERDRLFGPEGNNEMIELLAELAELRAEVEKAFERHAEAHKAISAMGSRIDALTKRLDAVTGVRK